MHNASQDSVYDTLAAGVVSSVLEGFNGETAGSAARSGGDKSPR